MEKTIDDLLQGMHERDYVTASQAAEVQEDYVSSLDLEKTIKKLRKKMKGAADRMDFEEAAEYRDRIRELERRQIEEGL